MAGSRKQIGQIASVYIGTVIGAGFASGQEMIQFFTRYGLNGMYGILLAGVLHAFIGAVLLEIVFKEGITNYKELLNGMMGRPMAVIVEIVVTVFLFVCFCAMVAGAGAIGKQQFGLPEEVGVILMVTVCLLTFFSGANGFVFMNTLLVPILAVGGIALSVYSIVLKDVSTFTIETEFVQQLTGNWITSSVLYVSYNTLTVVVVLSTMGYLLTSKKVARLGGMIGGLLLGGIGLSIGIATLMYYSQIRMLEIPILGILLNFPKGFSYFYMVVLLAAMYTTAIANGYGVIENVSNFLPVPKKLLIIVICALGMAGSRLGFSTIVAKVFPVFGYIGLFEIILLIVYYINRKRMDRRQQVGKRKKGS